MQAVILAAGQSSRFYPFGDGKHKSSEKLLGLPIIEHTIESVKKAGITDIIIVTGKNGHIRESLKNVKGLSDKITIVGQEAAKGMGNALLRVKNLSENFYVLHAHHMEFDQFARDLKAKQDPQSAVLLAKKAQKVDQFGVLKTDGDMVVDIVEKPDALSAPSNLCVIGMYLLPKAFLKTLERMPDEHYSFEKALVHYAKEKKVKVVITEKETISLKYPWDLLSLNQYLLRHAKSSISQRAAIHKTAMISGKVIIEEGAKILERATIKGPCYIGKGAYIGTNAIVRDFASVGEGVVVGAGMEIKNSILMDNATTHSGFIGDSVIGESCKIAAFFCTGNVRLDRALVKVKIARGSVETGLRSLGVCMGNDVQVGIRVSTMPGVLIGRNVVIGPSTTVFTRIPHNTRYYTTFHEVISEEIGEVAKNSHSSGKMVLFDIDYTLFDTDIFKESNLETYTLYNDVIAMLSSLQGIAKIGIFSEGQHELQKAKLLKTKIHDHFPEEHLHIVAKKDETLGQILKKYKKEMLFLVDDKLSILEAAKKQAPKTVAIWIKRGPYAIKQAKANAFLPDATISSLNEVIAIVANSN
ncbi:MAG: NTP transferase domain-containing protein [Candidatus Levybacteria bacterium]|nr:NTP transferase domain-containing protein [Candidatus Levybacteria bacterium]